MKPARRQTGRRWVAALLMLLLACGCRHSRPGTILVVTPTGGMEYWDKFNHAVREQSAALGIQVELKAPQSITDYTEQAQMVELGIAQHVQGIIVAPSHQLVLASALKRARQAGIPVVVVGAPVTLQPDEYSTYVSWDDVAAARIAARQFVAMLHGHGEVGIIGVSPTVENSSRIEKAFANEIARAPQIKLVSVKYGLSDWARSRQAALDMVAEHPRIRGILTADEFSTHAVALAFKPGARPRPFLIGISNEINELRLMHLGLLDALVISDPSELGKRSLQALCAAISGKDTSRFNAPLPVTLINAQSEGVAARLHAFYKED